MWYCIQYSVIGFAIYYINNNYIKEGFGIDNNEYQDKDTSKIFLIKNKVDGTYNVNTKIDKIDDKIDDEIVGLLMLKKQLLMVIIYHFQNQLQLF